MRGSPSCQPRTSTNDLLKFTLAGLLWITAVYASIDVNLELLKNSPPVPVSGFFKNLHALPCRCQSGLESMALWGRGGLSGLYDTHMGIEHWYNRLTWTLVSYGVHDLFLALKLKKAGDIESNPGPNTSQSTQSSKAQEKHSQARARRATRLQTREEAKTPQLRSQVQAGEFQTTIPFSQGTQSSTSVSSLHLTPETGSKQERYETPISRELEEAESARRIHSEEVQAREEEHSGRLVTSTPLKQPKRNGNGSDNMRGEDAPCVNTDEENAGSEEEDMSVETREMEGSGTEVESEPEPKAGATEEPRTHKGTEVTEEPTGETGPKPGLEPETEMSREPVASKANPTLDELFTSKGESPEEVHERATDDDVTTTDDAGEAGEIDEVTTDTTTTVVNTTSTTTSSGTVHSTVTTAGSSRTREEETGSTPIHKGKVSHELGHTSPFTHFPGHYCGYDKTKKSQAANGKAGPAEEYNMGTVIGHGVCHDNDSDTRRAGTSRREPRCAPTMGEGPSEDEEVVFTEPSPDKADNTRASPTRANSYSYSSKSGSVRTGSTTEPAKHTSESASASMRYDSGSTREREGRNRGARGGRGRYEHRNERERGSESVSERRPAQNTTIEDNQTRPDLTFHPSPHPHNYWYRHPNTQTHSPQHNYHYNQADNQPYPTNRTLHTRTQAFNNQPLQDYHGHGSQRFQHQHYQHSQPYQQAHPANLSHISGGYAEGGENDKVSGFANPGPSSQPKDAMNEYFRDCVERDTPQENTMASILGMIMGKMDSQQNTLQKQLQSNQANTERGIVDTQRKISNMHKDIQDIQQGMKETNLEVQQNKEDIKTLHDRQEKLESKQDSALAQTQKELSEAKEEIRQMKLTLEEMDDAIDARDEEMEEIQDELMEARKKTSTG